jgi:hypothetical protein
VLQVKGHAAALVTYAVVLGAVNLPLAMAGAHTPEQSPAVTPLLTGHRLLYVPATEQVAQVAVVHPLE